VQSTGGTPADGETERAEAVPPEIEAEKSEDRGGQELQAPEGAEVGYGQDISNPEEASETETPPDGETPDGAEANGRAFEELVTGAFDPETDEEEILDLEEAADTEEEQLSPERDDEGESTSEGEDGDRDPIGGEDTFDSEQTQAGGLSDEERGDLEKLITGLREESFEGASPAVMKEVRRQLKVTDARVAKLGKMVLACDRRLRACYEAMRLHQEKTELMNRRIDALVAAMSNGKRT
jgi:hypothetical protein